MIGVIDYKAGNAPSVLNALLKLNIPSIAHKNIFAAQFHIEKSGAVGLKLLRNFALMAGGKLCCQKD
jgi:imidazoleglycerol phosphate synthase glutamine amidotransferase subunit HisH